MGFPEGNGGSSALDLPDVQCDLYCGQEAAVRAEWFLLEAKVSAKGALCLPIRLIGTQSMSDTKLR